MLIGILIGRERSFPQALADRIAQIGGADVECELLSLDTIGADDAAKYDVILDRISHHVPFYRSAMKHAVLAGSRVVNDPFWSAADDKFFGYSFATRLGLNVPRTALLPNKDPGPDVSPESLQNLRYPLDWEGLVERIGLPAYLKPAHGGGWEYVHRVESLDDLLRWYDLSGTRTLVLQEAVDFDRYVRIFCIGRDEVIVTRYEPSDRTYLPLGDDFDEAVLERVARDALAITRALGYDVNTVEFAIRDGEPWAIDFTNPVPDMELESITPIYFDRVVDAMARFLIRAGAHDRPGRAPKTALALMADDLGLGRPTSRSSRRRGGGTGRAPAKKSVATKTGTKKSGVKESAATKKTAAKKTATRKAGAKKPASGKASAKKKKSGRRSGGAAAG